MGSIRVVMTGRLPVAPYSSVTWTVYNQPDKTGAQSGYGANYLTDVGVDYIIAGNSVNPISLDVSGDLSGSLPDPNVVAIQNVGVTSTVPVEGQALMCNSDGYWAPSTNLRMANSNVVVGQIDSSTNSATGKSLTIHAQDMLGTSTTGGSLTLRAGTGAVASGNVSISGENISVSGGLTITDSAGLGININQNGGGDLKLATPDGVTIEGPGIFFDSNGGSSVNVTALEDSTLTKGVALTLSGGTTGHASSDGGDVIVLVGSGASFAGNVSLFAEPTHSGSAGGGGKCLFIGRCDAEPSTNPVAGIILYVDSSGNLKARTQNGNVRTIAAV